MNEIKFVNKQFLEFKITYNQSYFENRYYLTYFYVNIKNKWILIRKERIKIIKFNNVIIKFILKYEHKFNDCHINITFLDDELLENKNLLSHLSGYNTINKLLSNINKIPYYKQKIHNGIRLSTSHSFKKELLQLCKENFGSYDIDVIYIDKIIEW
jgi:hypothetical protein